MNDTKKLIHEYGRQEIMPGFYAKINVELDTDFANLETNIVSAPDTIEFLIGKELECTELLSKSLTSYISTHKYVKKTNIKIYRTETDKLKLQELNITQSIIKKRIKKIETLPDMIKEIMKAYKRDLTVIEAAIEIIGKMEE